MLNSLLVEGGPNGLAAINAIGATIWNYRSFRGQHYGYVYYVYTPAVIYNRETGEVAYPSTSGHKH